jgi:hypothetical protein
VRITTSEEVPGVQPVTFRLPRPGHGDPHFGLSRSHYYVLEKRGLLRLIRLRAKNKTRGVTLISFEDVARLVRAQTEDGKAEEHLSTKSKPGGSQCE